MGSEEIEDPEGGIREALEASAEAIEAAARAVKRGDAHGGHDRDCGCGHADCERTDDLVTDDVVDGIDPTCGDGAGLADYHGYLQEVPGCSGLWRLYLTLGLDDYLLLCDEEIVAQRQRSDGSSVVWVRRDRPVRRTRVRTPDQERIDYLQGQIADLWAGASRGTPGPGGVVGTALNSSAPCPLSLPSSRCKPC